MIYAGDIRDENRDQVRELLAPLGRVAFRIAHGSLYALYVQNDRQREEYRRWSVARQKRQADQMGIFEVGR